MSKAQQIDSGINLIDIAMVKLALDNDSRQIPDPQKVIADYLDGVTEEAIVKRIQLRKRGKFITTRNKNGLRYTRIDITDKFIEKVYGKSFASHLNGGSLHTNGNGLKPKPEVKVEPIVVTPVEEPKKAIWILVDYWNIKRAEDEFGDKISYMKLRDYARKKGKVIFCEIYAPHHFQEKRYAHETSYFTKLDWDVIIVGDSVKDKDQVDTRLMNRVRRITHHDQPIQTELWIVTRDRDFQSVVELNKDRGNHNIKLLDPFTLSQIRGLVDQEVRLLMQEEVAEIVEIMHSMTPQFAEDEDDKQKFVRYAMAWLLLQKSEIIEYKNFGQLLRDISDFLSKRFNNRIKKYPEFVRFLVFALRNKAVITQVKNGNVSCKYVIDKKHEMFSIATPESFMTQVSFTP